ncbi:MAG: DNA-3-methyladenine glycosylase 2 family protein [Oscillospiraceae bacterium]|nr:DNA-3-methyladenine glycosylase 2 family protein [Oscillospiraceae bacterium]
MDITYEKDLTILSGLTDFDADKIFDCGQCFRWLKQSDGSWRGIAHSRVMTLSQEENRVTLSAPKEDFESIWHNYFDLERDYEAMRSRLGVSDYMTKACEFGKGIRILRQEPWEALCTFIISQCNNIARIRGIVERLCALKGEELGEGLYSFPSFDTVASLSEEDLAPLRSGYRAKYILEAARAVSEGRFDLDAACKMNADDAMKALLTLEGVGKKVAGCVMLFGLGKTEAFPIDTWMKKALKEYFEEGFDPRVFGDDAGIAQQYIFYYARWGGTV